MGRETGGGRGGMKIIGKNVFLKNPRFSYTYPREKE